MADELESVRIGIGGDLTPLETALESIPSLASSAARQVNDALSSASGADGLTSSVQAAAKALGTDLPQGAAAAAGSLGTVSQAAGETSSAADSMTASGSRLEAQLNQIIAALNTMAEALQQNTEAEEKVAQHSEEAATGIAKISETIEGMKQVAEAFIAIALAEKLGEIAGEAVHLYGESQRVETSLGMIGGSSKAAAEQMEKLDEMAMHLAVPLEQLEGSAQKLSAVFGVGEGLTHALEAAANASAATGNSFQSVAAGLERVQITGAVTGRQLIAMGISWEDLAHQMGVSVEEAQQKLKKGGQEAEKDVETLIETINAKFGDAAKKQAEGVSGQMIILANESTKMFRELGSAIAPALLDLVKLLRETVIPAVENSIIAFKNLPGPLKDIIVYGGAAVVALIPLAGGLATLGFALEGVEILLTRVGIKMGAEAVAATGMATANHAAAIATEELAVAEEGLAVAGGSGFLASAKAGILAALPEIALAIGPAAAAILATKEGIDRLKEAWEDFRLNTKEWKPISEESKQEIKKAFSEITLGIDVMKGEFSKGTREMIENQRQLNIAYDEAKRTFNELTKAHAEGKVSMEVVTAAQVAMTKAFDAAHPAYKSTIESLAELTKTTAEHATNLTKAREVYSQALAALAAGTGTTDLVKDAWKQLTKAVADSHNPIQHFKELYDDAVKSWKEGSGTLAQVTEAWKKYADAAKSAHQPVFDIGMAIRDASKAASDGIIHLNNLADAYLELKRHSSNSITEQLTLAEMFKTVATEARKLGLDVTNLGTGLHFEVEQKGKSAALGIKALADELNAAKAPLEGTAVTINGKLVPALQSVADMGQQIEKGVQVVRNLPVAVEQVAGSFKGTVAGMEGTVNTFTGSVADMNTEAGKTPGVFLTAGDGVAIFGGKVEGANAHLKEHASHIRNATSALQDHGSTIINIDTRYEQMTQHLDALGEGIHRIITIDPGQGPLIRYFNELTGSMQATANGAHRAAAAIKDAIAEGVGWKPIGWKGTEMGGGGIMGLKGQTVSGGTFLQMLGAMPGVLEGDLDRAALAMGYVKLGNRNYVSQAEADSMPTLGGMLVGTKWDPARRAAQSGVQSAPADTLGLTAEDHAKLTASTNALADAFGTATQNIVTASQNVAQAATMAATATTEAQSSVTQSAAAVGQAVAALIAPITSASGTTPSNTVRDLQYAASGGAMAVTVNVSAGTVVGQNGMGQLADMMGQVLVTRMRQVTGLKFG